MADIIGTDGNDELEGTTGDDRIEGLSGDDGLIGSPGADTLDGGGGFDFAFYVYSESGITIDLSAAPDADGYVRGAGGVCRGRQVEEYRGAGGFELRGPPDR